MQGLFSMLLGKKISGSKDPEVAQGRQTMFNQLPDGQQAFAQLTPQQQQWMGGADATDPFILNRMPQAAQPTPSVQPQSDVLDPKSVAYKDPNAQQRRRGGGDGGVSAASAPGLSGGGGAGGGAQYSGGIPIILRSYGEPSAGLLRYIEG